MLPLEPDSFELVHYHYKHDIGIDDISIIDETSSIFDDLMTISFLPDDEAYDYVAQKYERLLMMYDDDLSKVFKLKLFLGLAVVLCVIAPSPQGVIALFDKYENDDGSLFNYAHLDVGELIERQISTFGCKMNKTDICLGFEGEISLKDVLRKAAECSDDFSALHARYITYLVKNDDFMTLLDTYSGSAHSSEVLVTAFVDEMLLKKDGMSLLDIKSDIMFEMLFNNCKAETQVPRWKLDILKRISEEQRRIEPELYFSPQYSAIRVVMSSESIHSLIKAHEFLSEVDPLPVIPIVTRIEEVLFIQSYFKLDPQTVLCHIEDSLVRERFLRHLGSNL